MHNSSVRPKIKLPRTKSEWIFDIVGLSVYIGMIVLLIVVWNKLPEQVPAHYNAVGEVDRWGSKWELVILPFVGLLTTMMMFVFEFHPEIHNYPKRFNEVNAKQFYLNSRQLINRLKNITLIVFSLIMYESIAIALGWSSGFGPLFLPIILLLSFTPIVISLVKRRKIR